jgi:Flp pilus assembly protein TadG
MVDVDWIRRMFDFLRRRFGGKARLLPGVTLVRRFARQEKGATAVEFAMIAIPFLGMTFAIIETALVFFAGQTLETAVADSARKIMTGQAQTQGWNQDRFKQEVCGRIYGLFDCNNIRVDVKTYSSFSDANMSKPIDANGQLTNNFSYQTGGPGDIVVARLMYEWPVNVPFLGLNLSDMSGGKRLLVATAAFRNEPFQPTQAPN